MASLVIDIETVGEDWEQIDEQTKKVLLNRTNRFSNDSEESLEEQTAKELGISPFTGQIVALGVLDATTHKGAVYYQSPKKEADDEQDGILLKVTTEQEMLKKFWELSSRYDEFVTFSGRSFDLPYIMIRSAIHNIRPGKDLMRGRYLYQQLNDARHIDLYDQLNFYGSFNRLGGLHLACRAFGIETPKSDDIDGSKVGDCFKHGQCKKIAEYNARDILATAKLYDKWKKLLAF